MRMYDMIAKKRKGQSLTKREIDYIIQKYTVGNIPDYQMSALLMAIYFQGMTQEELAHLTMAMTHSGEIVDLSSIKGITVDKHSTGGVGDSVTIPLIPLVASCGVPIPKMSGRGLGHTGGTLDKLESIPGFNIHLSKEKFIEIVNQHKQAIVGQTANLVPADQKIYELRDVTATVHSIPLIASSIMSKKIASGADAFVLDVKTGSGAFMETYAEAEKLAQAMVDIGELVGKRTVAVISNMNEPLGYAIGNSLEVIEAIETLQGKGPEDLTKLCLTLGSHMLTLAKESMTFDEAYTKLTEHLHSGKALKHLSKLIENQGGNPAVIEDPTLLPQAEYTYDVPATHSGYVTAINAEQIGIAAMQLGAGRQTIDSTIDLSVGLVLNKKIGDTVQIGESIATIHANQTTITSVKEKIQESITINKIIKQPLEKQPLIYEVITK